MHDDAPDPQLLSIAGSISDREPLDWEGLRNQLPADQAEIVEQLRFVESVARLGEDAPTVWGPYAIVGEIGRGAFGTVYRAYDPELNREVALKVVRPVRTDAPFDPERAVGEARTVARVNHPNVVRVFRVDRIGDEIGMAMELIPGDVVTLEPGLYRQGFGGCRLEDLVLVTEDGAENLTDFPYDLTP